jgi:hypothetical protein
MKIGLFALLVLGAALALATPSSAQISTFTGHWQNTNKNTRGIVDVDISDSGSNNVSVHAFGACSPQPCDWGNAEAYAYSPSVDQNVGQSAVGITAVVTTSFSVTILIVRLRDADNLTVTSYTRFTDSSGRAAYREEGLFHRQAHSIRAL